MNADSPSIEKYPTIFGQANSYFKQETGRSLRLWAVVAVLNFATQIILHRELVAPSITTGEFSSLNTILGVAGLMIVPVAAIDLAFVFYLAQRHAPERQERLDALRAAAPLVTQTVALIWGGLSIVLLFFLLPLLNLPRFSLSLFTLLTVLMALGGVVSGSLCHYKKSGRLWGWLLVAAALTRVIFSASLVWREPVVESALAVFLLAGFITLTPVLLQAGNTLATMKEWRAMLDRDFLVYLGATFSVILALFLFSSADRIIAQSWFGRSDNNNLGWVDWSAVDSYQTAGLLGRALFWGAEPLLLILFMQRLRLSKTTSASLKFFWIYVGVLLAGAALLALLSKPLSWLFCGVDSPATYSLVPAFALAMALFGLIQGVGMFALASRRYPECFVLGGCGIAYTLLLYFTGRQPVMMLAYMFGGGLFSFLLVLFVGVVRWGRKQP